MNNKIMIQGDDLVNQVNPVQILQSSVLKYTPNSNHILLLNSNCNMKNLIKTIVYLRLKNNDSFWYYIEFCDGYKLTGLRKVNSKWVYVTVQLSKIAFYY